MSNRHFQIKNHDISELDQYEAKCFTYLIEPNSFWKNYFKSYQLRRPETFIQKRKNEISRYLYNKPHIELDLVSLHGKPGIVYALNKFDYLKHLDRIENFINKFYPGREIIRVMVDDLFTIFVCLGEKVYESKPSIN